MKKFIILISAIIAFGSYGISHATTFFEFDGESGYQYLGSENAHPGGGYFSRLGGNINSPEGNGCDNPLEFHNTILSNAAEAQGAATNSQYALKTPYSGSCPNESFSRDTTIIRLDEDKDEIYVRWYQKWTGDWNSADVQHKFTKFCSYNYTSNTDAKTAHFSFQPNSNSWRNFTPNLEDRFDMNGVEHYDWVWIYETEEAAGSQYSGVARAWDDINNEIGDGGSDAQFIFETGKWYCLEIHVKMNSSADSADAVCEAWVDGTKVFEIRNFKYYNDSANKYGTGYLELQHIYYNRSSSDQPTYMDNIIVSDTYNGPINNDADTSSDLPAPTGIKIIQP